MYMELDDFLSHKSGRGRKVLTWKKRRPPAITTWLHTRALLATVWRHPWVRLVERDVDGELVREYWGEEFVCHESEEVLRRQYRVRDGRREVPPVKCPFCKLLAYLREQIEDGHLKLHEKVFVFDAGDEERVYTAGGLCNAFRRDMSADEKAALKKAGVRLNEAWKQNAMAKCSYIFTIADHDDLAAGPQVCVETTALGDAVKEVVRQKMAGCENERDGNPLINPYAIRWEYHEDEPEFGKKYRAYEYGKAKYTSEVEAVIRDADPPDISALTQPGDVERLRASMESAARIALPFDDFFGESSGGSRAGRGGDAGARKSASRGGSAPEPARAVRGDAARGEVSDRAARGAARARPAVKMIPCDECGAPMPETATECPACGARYELDEEGDVPW